MAAATQTRVAPHMESHQQLRLSNDHSAYPPIEKFLTIDGLLKSHASEADQPPLICFPATGAADYEEHTATDLDTLADAACARYIELGLQPAVRFILSFDYYPADTIGRIQPKKTRL